MAAASASNFARYVWGDSSALNFVKSRRLICVDAYVKMSLCLAYAVASSVASFSTREAGGVAIP